MDASHSASMSLDEVRGHESALREFSGRLGLCLGARRYCAAGYQMSERQSIFQSCIVLLTEVCVGASTDVSQTWYAGQQEELSGRAPGGRSVPQRDGGNGQGCVPGILDHYSADKVGTQEW